jgi:hypothetical protein
MKPLTPEQFAYAVMQATGPKETADKLDARVAPRLPPFRAMFAARAGESQDGFSATLDQTLFLKYGGVVRGLIAPTGGNLADRLAKITDTDAFADELFVSVLSRRPTADEKKDVADALRNAKDRNIVIGELVWALVASAEFRFNH